MNPKNKKQKQKRNERNEIYKQIAPYLYLS